jgi:signal transduction histidine kinase
MDDSSTIERLRQQQSALADFGTFAFSESDLQAVLSQAARMCARSLDVPFAKICRYRVAENDLLIVAGVGWRGGVVGRIVSSADETSTQGRAYVTGNPVVLEDVSQNSSLALPAFYRDHGIVSTADVLIKGRAGPWGVLEVDCATKRHFDEHDIVFLTGFANVVAEAVAITERAAAQQNAIDRLTQEVEKNNRLLAERERNERQLRELQSELLRASRLTAMGHMTAAIAHELNQPLAAIANYIGAAKRTLASKGISPEGISRAQAMIVSAQEQTLRAGGIIKNLRNIVEKRDARRTAQDIGTVVHDSLAAVLFGADEAKIAVELNIEPGIPAVLIDAIQIQQILVNLVRNSMEAMGAVELRKLAILVCRGEPGFANVSVQDTGVGLPRNVLDRLFQPFVTTKGEGMGLGLMICRTLAEANGGRIWCLKDLSVGTGFSFSVPFVDADDGKKRLRVA